MTRFFLLCLVAVVLGGCLSPGENVASRSLWSGQYEADVKAVLKPAFFVAFYTYVSHEAWPDSSVSYFPGTSQDTRYPGQCGPVPFNPNKGDRFRRDGTTVPC